MMMQKAAICGNCDTRAVVRVTAVALVLAAALALAPPASAAAPRYILVSGPGLARPVLLQDHWENLRLLVPLVKAPRMNRDGLARRPRFDLALFWGWPERPPTRPRDANQHGWFYPARGPRPAVVDLRVNGERFPRRAPREVLRIFARYGIPTRL
jgi:hypothetical protein